MPETLSEQVIPLNAVGRGVPHEPMRFELVEDRLPVVEVLAQIASGMNSDANEEQMLQRFLEIMMQLSGAKAGAVRVLTTDGGHLRMVGSVGLSPTLQERERYVPLECGICGRAILAQDSMSGNVLTVCQKQVRHIYNAQHSRTVYAIPMRHKGKVLGVYNLFMDHDRPLPKDVSYLFNSISEHLGMALENARITRENMRISLMNERTMLANQIHDSLAQTLAYAKMRLTVLNEAISSGDGERTNRYLGDVEEAISALRRVLELDGGDQPALEALSTLYRREKRWLELASVLARARDLAASDEARVAFQVDVAALYENELGEDEAAVEAWRSVLAMDDRNAEGLAGLERLYTKLDRFAELNRVYDRQVALAEDPREQVRILAKSAAIFEEKMHDPAQATGQNERILAIDGGNLPAVKALERLCRDQGLWEKLISVMQHHLTLVKDREETVALEVAIGDVWWTEMARVDRAEAILNHALKLDPNSREAVSALGRLYERIGEWDRC